MQTNKNTIIVAVLALVVGIMIGFVCRVNLSSVVNQEGATIKTNQSNQTDRDNSQNKIYKCLDDYSSCTQNCMLYGSTSPLFMNCFDTCISNFNVCKVPYK